jgi:hypothetical protein
MKATIDIPDELYRRVKARTALEGRTVREVTTELYRRWLEEAPAERRPGHSGGDPGEAHRPGPSSGEPGEAWLEGWEELGRRIAEDARDPRTTRQILLDDRR